MLLDSARPTAAPRFRSGPALALVSALAVGACSDLTDPADRIVEGVNLTELFAEPSPGEVAVVSSEWAARSPAASDTRVEATFERSLAGRPASLRVVSTVVDGQRQYGLVQAVDDAAPGSLAVLVFAHGGDGGTSASEVDLLTGALGDLAADFVVVAPTFRSEPLEVGEDVWVSEGAPSPWDRDVDDALAFIQAGASVAPQADPTRVAVVGFSRGGGVALLMGIREAGIDQVVEFFGPTDMFSPWVEEVVALALQGFLVDLPGLDALNEQVIQPLRRGEITMEAARIELVRRSSVLFADRLPNTQAHHGSRDLVVPVDQAEALFDVMESLGREPPAFEGFIYPTGTHDPLSLPGATERTIEALVRVRDGS